MNELKNPDQRIDAPQETNPAELRNLETKNQEIGQNIDQSEINMDKAEKSDSIDQTEKNIEKSDLKGAEEHLSKDEQFVRHMDNLPVPERPEDRNTEFSNVKEQFQPENWSKMNPEERRAAVDDFSSAVSKDLGLENPPEVRYYMSDNTNEYGGYSKSENAIYLNENAMQDGPEVADTIAHEHRHAWQHEHAEHPQTEEDYRFKDNFDDYIRPEDDYRGYKEQPVEADARDYAANICQDIERSETVQSDLSTYENDRSNIAIEDKVSPEKGAVFEHLDEAERKIDKSLEVQVVEVNQNIKDINDDPTLPEYEKSEKIAEQLQELGFTKMDANDVNAFTDRDIEVVVMDGNQELYRRGWDTEGMGDYGYGSWWSEHPMSVDEARNGLAICQDWGNPLTGKYVSQPEEGTLVCKGKAASQTIRDEDGNIKEHRNGGANQYFINSPEKDWCRKVE